MFKYFLITIIFYIITPYYAQQCFSELSIYITEEEMKQKQTHQQYKKRLRYLIEQYDGLKQGSLSSRACLLMGLKQNQYTYLGETFIKIRLSCMSNMQRGKCQNYKQYAFYECLWDYFTYSGQILTEYYSFWRSRPCIKCMEL
ncbi:hypothetical protein IMG5_024060 [Ichthyophthirius multifiliis]|uniref:Uncharacterized protein n=1 Tax=Ichthyophthirius multifiliis TaxID=5932 RepID=G0QL06_ICHMU|nr:hypothetical protein IMG5_024060 [Ichthyophthirius multifiliis]EGR34101.1 hypothetical protein IMG5_024060 [Ichthyophthirius multifiliis]|eukprot:XP_004039405.1 hypothetical protein IMG5_024060 [Ichthyophthirius multifiliis]